MLSEYCQTHVLARVTKLSLVLQPLLGFIFEMEAQPEFCANSNTGFQLPQTPLNCNFVENLPDV